VPVEVFTADDLVDGTHRVAFVVETAMKQCFVSFVFAVELALLVLSGWGKIRFERLALLTHSSTRLCAEAFFDEFGVCEVHSQAVLSRVFFHSFVEIAATVDGEINSHPLFSMFYRMLKIRVAAGYSKCCCSWIT